MLCAAKNALWPRYWNNYDEPTTHVSKGGYERGGGADLIVDVEKSEMITFRSGELFSHGISLSFRKIKKEKKMRGAGKRQHAYERGERGEGKEKRRNLISPIFGTEPDGRS